MKKLYIYICLYIDRDGDLALFLVFLLHAVNVLYEKATSERIMAMKAVVVMTATVMVVAG